MAAAAGTATLRLRPRRNALEGTKAGGPIHDMYQVSRHRNVDVLMGYIRRAEAWQNNPTAAIGL